MSIKLVSQPVKNKVSGVRSPRIEMEMFASTFLSGGMVTCFDPRNLQDNQFQLLQNIKTIYDRIQRRPGLALFTPVKPNSEPVLSFVSYDQNDGTVSLVRFTRDSVYLAGSSSWTQITGDPLAGDDNDRFTGIIVDDRLFFANNGANVIQEIDINTLTYDDLGNAPEYRYITGFGDRVIGANLVGTSPDPTQIGWSGNLNFDEWDPSTDISAGFQTLVASPSDRSDFIQGVYGFADNLVIPRQHSIWEATKQGSATYPFNFQTRVPGVGTDSPYSLARLPNGLAFLDGYTRDIYVYSVGGDIQSIGQPVREDILNAVSNAAGVYGSYNQKTREYSIVVVSSFTTTARVWTYSFITQGWWYEEYKSVSFIGDLAYAGSSVRIEDLFGTINSLQGNIEDLSPHVAAVTRFFGFTSGELAYVDETKDEDWNYTYDGLATSKTFEIPKDNIYVANLQIEYVPLIAGGFTIEYSTDGGNTFTVASSVTYGSDELSKYQIYNYKKQLMARRYIWRIRSGSGSAMWRNYTIWVTKAGDQKR